MSISTSYAPITNTHLPLNSAPIPEAKLNVQVALENKVQTQPDTFVHLSQGATPVTPANIDKTTSENTQASTESNLITTSSTDISESVNQIDDDAKEEENNPNTQAPADTNAKDEADSQSEYTEEELALIDSLKLRDAEVETHERAHAIVGGQYAGSPSYTYETGPDGVKYAVSGEVSIDTSRIPGDPQATLQKARQIKVAALAPAEPSTQDRRVAAKADQMATQARNDILEEQRGGESQNSSQSIYEASVPDHFEQTGSLSSNQGMDDATQTLMQDRNSHIKALYQDTSKVSANPHFSLLSLIYLNFFNLSHYLTQK
ncbi:putative metalloprotease CJM1_0395 family protein [Psychromonas sp. KJ10-10]|uniref:putative metalloprotease CJM1_0395 family protein n=1 Tax=Psychromonas sp. KJ10-10 TaxID=3391823 RepID=UPI0039B39ACC